MAKRVALDALIAPTPALASAPDRSHAQKHRHRYKPDAGKHQRNPVGRRRIAPLLKFGFKGRLLTNALFQMWHLCRRRGIICFRTTRGLRRWARSCGVLQNCRLRESCINRFWLRCCCCGNACSCVGRWQCGGDAFRRSCASWRHRGLGRWCGHRQCGRLPQLWRWRCCLYGECFGNLKARLNCGG